MRGWIVAAAILVIVILSLPAPFISCREVAMTFGASELELALGQAKSAMFDATLRQLFRPEYNVQVDR